MKENKRSIIAIGICCAMLLFIFVMAKISSKSVVKTNKTEATFTTAYETPTSTPIPEPTVDPAIALSDIKDKICQNAIQVTYDEIARYSADYRGKYVKVSGKVIQAQNVDSGVALRMNITPTTYGYDDTILVYMPNENHCTDTKILENDIITVYGIGAGDFTYESILHAQITAPLINAYVVKFGSN